MAEIRLPQFGMGMSDGTILAWHKAIGDRVAKGEILCDIEAAKTTVEMESPEAGVLRRILVDVDQNVPVDTVIAEIDIETATIDLPAGSCPKDTLLAKADVPAKAAPVQPATATAEVSVQVEPAARKAARELGVDLGAIKGSGPSGRIVVKDVQAYSEQSRSAAVASPAPPPNQDTATADAQFTEIAHTITRRTIARRLTESKQQVPHFYVKAACRIDSLLALRKQMNESGGTKVSVNDLVVKAVALALMEVPDANVAWGEKSMRRYNHVDAAIAVATPRGLVTPIVRNAELKSVGEIATEVKELAGRARDSKLKPEEYNGGTVSVSNLGMFGVEEFTAILNPPQSTIFAVGAGIEQPVVSEGRITVATLMTVTISVDHRAVDGTVAAQLLAAFKRIIEEPAALVA